ncbi:hypothetical protein [uncultured Pseudoalteromonas sp.]|uniref:hypothetical protein n=1 Tax=uncultured Pseudoalteromonas sp. TaxID=114053 RepID=UPI0030DD2A3E
MAESKTLIVTSSYDKTCNYLVDKYRNFKYFRLDVDRFSEYQIIFTQQGFEIRNSTENITSSSCHSIYFRKPSMENLHGIFENKYHGYMHKETYSFIEGIAESFSGLVLSKPSIMRKANNKVYQASLISKVGFVTPTLSITNSSTALDQFTSRKGVIKPIAVGEVSSGSVKEYVQTNMIDPSIKTDLFHYSPVYLQDYIDKDFEVRVTVVNELVFSVKINSVNNVDWRKPNNKVKYSIYQIPDQIKKQCFEFMRLCGMKFGCFDFIIKDDLWFFLEMNANGQWAWLEFETGLNISGAIIDFLTGNSGDLSGD